VGKSGGYPEPVERLIEGLQRLPGIGRRTASRLAFHLLKAPAEEGEALAAAMLDVKRHVACCQICWQLTDVQPCHICNDPDRHAGCILVLEQPRDLMSIEATGLHRGVYHVLTGRLDPLGGIGPDDITIASLMERIDRPERNARGRYDGALSQRVFGRARCAGNSARSRPSIGFGTGVCHARRSG